MSSFITYDFCWLLRSENESWTLLWERSWDSPGRSSSSGKHSDPVLPSVTTSDLCCRFRFGSKHSYFLSSDHLGGSLRSSTVRYSPSEVESEPMSRSSLSLSQDSSWELGYSSTVRHDSARRLVCLMTLRRSDLEDVNGCVLSPLHCWRPAVLPTPMLDCPVPAMTP